MKYYQQTKRLWPRKYTICEHVIYGGLWAMLGCLAAMILLKIFGG